MSKSNLRLIAPTKEIRTVVPVRRPNGELRPREHLTEREVEKLIKAAGGNRYGARDSCMLRICFRHALRASELCDLQWADVEFETATLHIRRAKGGTTATHPLLGDELRALRILKREANFASFPSAGHRLAYLVCRSWWSALATWPRSAPFCTRSPPACPSYPRGQLRELVSCPASRRRLLCFRRTRTHAINAAPLLCVIIRHQLRHSDQIIKSEHSGTDRQRIFPLGRTPLPFARDHPRPVHHTPGVNCGS